MIIAATGHRPPSLGGYKLPNPIYNKICQKTEKVLLELKPEKCISGMALGYDQYFAYVCHKLNIPFVAAIPFEGQELAWPEKSKKIYRHLLGLASEITVVCPGGYEKEKMQIRNEWMVDRCDKLIGVFNGDKSGGTFNCIEYAKKVGKDIIIIDPTL